VHDIVNLLCERVYRHFLQVSSLTEQIHRVESEVKAAAQVNEDAQVKLSTVNMVAVI